MVLVGNTDLLPINRQGYIKLYLLSTSSFTNSFGTLYKLKNLYNEVNFQNK